MQKVIQMGEREITLKSSAATNILYKRLFKEDIIVKLTQFSKNMKEMQRIQDSMNAIQGDENKSKEQKVEEISALLESDAYKSANEFQSETLPKLAFIMYVEANEPADRIFSKLTEENYFTWLMSVDQGELLSVTTQVIQLWNAGARNLSKLKNAEGR